MRSFSAKTAAASLVCLLWAATVALNWPGHLSTDSVIELLEGRIAHYESWHPAITSWLLGLADSLLRGTGLFILFTVTLLYGSLFLLVRLRGRVSWLALPAILLAAATPQFLLYPAIVWKDVLFAQATLAGFTCLAFAGARWQNPGQRLVFCTVSVLLFALASLTRQNGIVVALVAVPAYAMIARANGVGSQKAMAQALIFFAATMITLAVGMSALEERGDHGKGRADQIKMLQLYDLTAAAAHDPALRLPHLKRYAPKLDRLIRSDGARLYSPERVDTLQRSQRLSNARDATPLSFTTAEWRRLIFRRPLLYLQDRAEIFRWVFLTPKIERCVPFLVGVSGPPAILGMLDIAPRYDRRDARIEAYAQRLVNTPIFSHAFFVILGLAAGIVLMRRRSPSDIAMVFLLVAAGLFVLTFFVISLACDYRYLYLLDVAAMAAAIHVASAPLLFARFTER